ncbi:MAG: MBL fold metallo-hydrolase [Bacteroidales bacterium]|nr:MBL fold metallo-hydrolase [Bacteroidales bacterium]
MISSKVIVVIILFSVLVSFIFITSFKKIKPVMIKYLYNTQLPVIKENWKGNLIIDGQFTNSNTKENIPLKDVIKWKFTKNPQKEEKKADTFKLKFYTNNEFINSPDDIIVWFGHSSFFIRVNGISILTDPCYYDMPLIKRLVPIPCNTNQLNKIDYVIISHFHREHFDKKSIEEIFENNPNAKALIPLNGGKMLKKTTNNYEEAGWYQQFITSNKIKIYFLPARHWNRRNMFDYNTMLWGSFIIKTNEKTIYFAGDTGWGNHFEEIHKLFPDIDYALLPVGAYKPSFLMQREHISPSEAVKASNILGAKNIIPMHYGTYNLSDEPIGEPVRELKKLEKEKLINGNIHYQGVGETLILNKL